MEVFEGKVAVITGAASGIGRAIAERCAQEGMKVVLAGINEDNLIPVENELKAMGADALSVRTDVSRLSDIEALAQRTLDVFGAVHLLVNNAGVGAGGSVWDSTWQDWEWVMGVNLWGVIYGSKVFAPIMLAQDTECHIVNTSSIAGVLPYHPCAAYQVTKHAVVALSENLHFTLAAQGDKVGVSVLCPGWVKTRILESERNRPPSAGSEPARMTAEGKAIAEQMRQSLEAGLTPEQVADDVFQAIREKTLYVFTDTEYLPAVQGRMATILQSFERS